MKKNLVVMLSFLLAGNGTAYAALLEETCSHIVQELHAGPVDVLTKTAGVFMDEGKPYHGCIIVFKGNREKITEQQDVSSLFGDVLPFCPKGKIPSDLSSDALNKDGWCSDFAADGVDGTSYRVLQKNVFCSVHGQWDGGDDDNPSYIPATRYDIEVRCATK